MASKPKKAPVEKTAASEKPAAAKSTAKKSVTLKKTTDSAVQAQPISASAALACIGLIDVGNQSILFAQLASSAVSIESIGILEGGVVPTYRALCNPQTLGRMAAIKTSSKKPAGQSASAERADAYLIAAVLSPLMLDTETQLRIGVSFTDGSRSLQNVPVLKVGTAALRSLLPSLKNHLPVLADLARSAGDANPVLVRLHGSLSQAARVLENPYQGSFDAIIDGRAEGWVYNTLKPMDRVEVVLMEGDKALAYGVADVLRDDLRDAKKSDGHIKFVIPIPRRLYDGRSHTLRVMVADSNFVIPNSPRTFEGPNLNLESAREVIEQSVTDRLIASAAVKLGETGRNVGFEKKMCRALVSIENGDWSQARRILGALDAQLGGLPVVRLYSGILEYKARQFQRAIEMLKAVVVAAPEFIWAHVALGDACTAGGHFAEASDAFEAALKLAPGVKAIESRVQAMQLDNLLKNAEALKDPALRDKAIQACKRAILADPDNIDLTATLHRLSQPELEDKSLPAMMSHVHPVALALRHERMVTSIVLEAVSDTSRKASAA